MGAESINLRPVDLPWFGLVVWSNCLAPSSLVLAPPKRRHVVTPLQGLDLRVSTLSSVDTAIPKAFPDRKFRVSTQFERFCRLRNRYEEPVMISGGRNRYAMRANGDSDAV
jgi:hypothetical protein